MNWRALATALLLVGAALSGWALWSQRERDAGRAEAVQRPDYVLHDFELVVLDKQGRESFTLRAPLLERDPQVKTMAIATPLFLIPPRPGGNGGAWEVRSRSGWVSADNEELRLRGAVRAESVDAEGRPIRIATEQLNVFPQAKRATSGVPTTVTQPGLILNGRRLEADLESKRIHLAEVKVRYERTAR
ncbi:LPS export ABC transporter periplasmic protein LptC [Vulcaniibacterium tengchongense]|uniref:Lipopolysaccharide export system protein LptC n=1 Tax=Vulcaniibacterium tengchongense TaxID=1273429 RepID=A0A3N4W4M3_9GAMM|nr:LPS export ABC transporter periplasmic protein LptC [Vulcaniibacterium tengchongense]RPE81020.1 lipopolysaccharide export system protein LptC [Vulcaniibacterium tengchongense]